MTDPNTSDPSDTDPHEPIPVRRWLPPCLLAALAFGVFWVVRVDPDVHFCTTTTETVTGAEASSTTTTTCKDIDSAIEVTMLLLPALLLAAPFLDSAELAGFKFTRRKPPTTPGGKGAAAAASEYQRGSAAERELYDPAAVLGLPERQ